MQASGDRTQRGGAGELPVALEEAQASDLQAAARAFGQVAVIAGRMMAAWSRQFRPMIQAAAEFEEQRRRHHAAAAVVFCRAMGGDCRIVTGSDGVSRVQARR